MAAQDASTAAPLLTSETVPAYVKSHAAEITLFQGDATLTAKPIIGGNMNYAWEVTDGEKSIFVKQAPEFVAVFGPGGFPITSARMGQEIAVYNEWRAILGGELSARFLPEIYVFDDVNMVFAMEFFGGCDLLEKGLIDTGVVTEQVAAGLGEFMGKTHAATHSLKVPAERATQLEADFTNQPCRDIQLEFVFSKCYNEAETAAALRDDPAFMAEISALKSAYNGEVKSSRCLLHGDLHPGSIMVDGEGTVKIIDPEFTIYGPPGLDVGSVLSGLVLAAVHHKHSGTGAEALASLRAGAGLIWEKYSAAMVAEGIDASVVATIGVETVGYTVAEVCRTALGFAGGRHWLKFEDATVQAAAVATAMGIVERCMKERHNGGLDLLLAEFDTLAA